MSSDLAFYAGTEEEGLKAIRSLCPGNRQPPVGQAPGTVDWIKLIQSCPLTCLSRAGRSDSCLARRASDATVSENPLGMAQARAVAAQGSHFQPSYTAEPSGSHEK